jgi:tRNA 2-thiouridine synthesizing protein A
MSNDDGADWSHMAALDARGLRCPLPVLRARKLLLALKDGQRLLVEASDPMAAIDFPHFCAETGHRLVATKSDGTVLCFLIEKVDVRGSL